MLDGRSGPVPSPWYAALSNGLQRIIDAIDDDSTDRHSIVEATGLAHGTVDKALYRLGKRGILQRTSRGNYRRNPAFRRWVP